MRSDTTPAETRHLTVIWAETRDRIRDLLDSQEDIGGIQVPTSPGATVHDVLAHLSETATRAAKNPAAIRHAPLALPTAGSPARASTATELLVAWEDTTARIAELIDTDPQLGEVLITDAAMSEHDLRTALDIPGARNNVAVKVALDELSGRFSDRVAAANLPALRVTVEQWGTIAGDGHATCCVVADRFEFVRAMSGRRSAAEIIRWNWGVEPDIYLPVISEIGLPAHDIHERDPRIPKHMRDREFVL